MNIKDYIEIGKKKLTSGLTSDVYYNFRKLTDEDIQYLAKKLEKEAEYLTIVGIYEMGYKIAKTTRNRVYNYNPHLKKQDVNLKTELCPFKYVIFDDVITTFGTIRKCIMEIGKLPHKIICIVNRMNIIEVGN